VKSLAVLSLVIALAGCGADADRTTVAIGDAAWTVLLAPDDGMRGRSDFDGADGMLFTFKREVDPRTIAWVMDGVAFPLDIAWFDGNGDLVDTMTMPVCPAEPCPQHQSGGPYRWAIEAPVGAFAGLDAGARLDLDP
jgi:uncharacterized membrane protein (UPF0127 family)